MKRQTIGCLTKHIADKGHVPKIYKELLKLINFIYIQMGIQLEKEREGEGGREREPTRGEPDFQETSSRD